MRQFSMLLLLASLLTPAFAKDVKAPLSATLTGAKTIYIENHSDQYLKDHVYSELVKWGRFAVVNDPKSADIIAKITVENHVVGPNGFNYTVLTIVDPKTGETLWSASRPWHVFGSAAKETVRDFRKALP